LEKMNSCGFSRSDSASEREGEHLNGEE
jgi:hypothetical protein